MSIPQETLNKHLGILGINGSGKTYAAKGLIERFLRDGQRVCVFDPTGVYWGLKSSASGKSGGFPVVVFGGEHADMPISGLHGETIAEAIGTSNTPVIIDTSLMRGSERTRFFTDFAETIRIKNSGPLHLFIDEAHLFCPQGRVADPNSAQMLHAANNLISLGRSRGLRVTLISQRPAKLHKDSLSQVHSLIAMRLISPQDRAAVSDWIGSAAYAMEELRAELSSAFLSGVLGIPADIPQHASCIDSWLSKLKGDKREIFRAAADAQKIVDMVVKFHPDIACQPLRPESSPNESALQLTHL